MKAGLISTFLLLYHLMMAGFCLFMMVGVLMTYYVFDPNFSAFKDRTETATSLKEVDEDIIENGIHLRTGFVDADGLLVLQHCNACHSTQLISQNRMTKVGWKSTIQWMQATQNLWDLGEDEAIILTYLAKNYAPSAIGRRQT